MATTKSRQRANASTATKQAILSELEKAYERADTLIKAKNNPSWKLSDRFLEALKEMSEASSSASTGYTNIVTSLAIKAFDATLDIRNHQVQIGAAFSFRNVSETIVYPWLASNRFEGAKSGWQTRTFERPKPYMMTFDENIDPVIKVPFLTCFDEVETKAGNATEALTFLVYQQIRLRDLKKAAIATFASNYRSLNDIAQIVQLFNAHFSHKYQSKGASRLPVLAVCAVYTVMMEQVIRYNNKVLLPLKSHSAADERTKAAGDIEVAGEDNSIYEALEIKHGIPISILLIDECGRKIEAMVSKPERYYLLTTHANCRPDSNMSDALKSIAEKTGCQIVVNGVLPTMQYYLRLLTEPSLIFPHYLDLLTKEPAIAHEHVIAWRDILAKAK